MPDCLAPYHIQTHNKNTMTQLTSYLFRCLLVCTVALCSLTIKTADAQQAAIQEPELARIIKGEHNHVFQVALIRYEPRTGGSDRFVDLVSAVHIGDAQYYQDLNQRFTQYDAVLYEAIKPKDAVLPTSSTGKKSGLSAFQSGMADFLGLVFQMDHVDYSPSNFLHADLSPKEFMQSMENKGESIFSMVFNVWRASLSQGLTGQTPISNFEVMSALMAADRQDAFRKLMATAMMDFDSLKVLEGSEGSTIIAARNDRALSVLSQVLKDADKQSIAIFYGAGHLPDFHEKLVKRFDMVPVATEWLDVWTFK